MKGLVIQPSDMGKEITNTDLLVKIEALEDTMNQLVNQQTKDRENMKEVIKAFNAAMGAFQVLEWLAKIAKPILFLGGIIVAVTLWFKGIRV